MPVIGHAFVGLAAAVCTTPPKKRAVALALWAPAIAGVAYLPDVTRQVLVWAGLVTHWGIAHSLLFNIVAAAVVAAGLARLSGRRWLSVYGICLLLVISHILMDSLQGSDRRLLWPWSDSRIHLTPDVIPHDTRREAIFFGTLFAVFMLGWWIGRRRAAGKPEPVARPRQLFFLGIGYGLTTLILLAAATTHYLRSVRQRQLDRADGLTRRGQHAAALAVLDEADRWPYPVPRARIDYLRAEAYTGLRDRARAEPCYLRAVQTDPSYFWAVADLANFYASGPEPPAERRQRVQPYLDLLRKRFPDHPSAAHYVQQIDRKLQAPPTSRPTSERAGSAPRRQ